MVKSATNRFRLKVFVHTVWEKRRQTLDHQDHQCTYEKKKKKKLTCKIFNWFFECRIQMLYVIYTLVNLKVIPNSLKLPFCWKCYSYQPVSQTLGVLLWTKKYFIITSKVFFFSFKSFRNSHCFLSLYDLFVRNIFLGNITLATADSFWR